MSATTSLYFSLNYPSLLNLFKEHLAPNRTESASFLIWYLENYYRLDTLEAIDSVCDQKGDKGVDGIYVNESDSTITVFQSKISQRSDTTIGDVILKEFVGTLAQFSSKQALQNLLISAGKANVVALITRLELMNKIESYHVKGVFLSNIDLDHNGESYLKSNSIITFIGKSELSDTYISQKRTTPISTAATFDISGFSVAKYIVDSDTKAVIAPVRARELVDLQGIVDQSLFALNVRGPLGKTPVNKDIIKSIRDNKTHKFFPLFHNGITVICGDIQEDSNKISVIDYFVVNGCQSLSSLYDCGNYLTDELRILTKFIQVKNLESNLAENITRFSNNQNGVKSRDFKSNHPIQVRLQNEFRNNYNGEYFLEIKRGEPDLTGEAISNEVAGLYLMAFDLKEPWATHRKYQVFEDKYTDLWARPEVTADRIVMCHEMLRIILVQIELIKNQSFGKYVLTRYMLLYMLRLILENDIAGKDLIRDPKPYVRDSASRAYFGLCIEKLIKDVIVDVNGEVEEFGDDFDYRGRLRDEKWVVELSKKVVANYLKLVQRNRIDSFSNEWNRRTIS